MANNVLQGFHKILQDSTGFEDFYQNFEVSYGGPCVYIER